MGNSFDRDSSLSSNSRKPLGEILIEAGLVSFAQIELALQQQMQSNLKIGEILANHGWIKQQTADFFVDSWAKLIQSKQRQPLVYYFKEAGLLDQEQIQALLEEQKQHHKKIRFHHLAVEKGYLKQITVDYFLAHLFKKNTSKVFSFTKPYEILRNYIQGQTEFQRAELMNAPLMGISLKGVQLDFSNLKEANLQGSNLSCSSMIQVNLAHSNLKKAILTEVNLEQACLNQANLSEAHLDKVNFKAANLQEADLTNAYLLKTSFAAADLRGAKLPLEYPYEVYYDSETCFDDSFDPVGAGWIQLTKSSD